MNKTEFVEELAHAKLNLTLETLGKLPNGYHDIATIITTITLADTVRASHADTISVECDGLEIPSEANLAYKAAQMLRSVAKVDTGAAIHIVKRIPVAAGLGGGSADAAATIRALNRLWKLHMSIEDLAAVGAQVGSDVPFLVHEGAAAVFGRGEKVAPLPKPNLGWIVLACPAAGTASKTPRLFGKVTPSHYSSGALTNKLAARIRARSDCPAELLFNVFADIAPDEFDDWRETHRTFSQLGAREIALSGTGPSMFAFPPMREIGVVWQLMLNRKSGVPTFLERAWHPHDEA